MNDEYIKVSLFNLIVLLVLIIFARSLSAFTLWFAYLFVFFFPGYLVLTIADLKSYERIALATPVSFALTFYHFLLSRVGIASINIPGMVGLYILIGILLLYNKKK